MATYKIPNEDLDTIKFLSELSQIEFNDLIGSLHKLPIMSDFKELETSLSEIKGIAHKKDSLASVLYSLYALKVKLTKTPEIFIDEIWESIQIQKDDKLKSRLIELLSISNIGSTIKAYNLLEEYDKIYNNCRIISDIRPTFEDTDTKIIGATVVHLLKIQYLESKKLNYFFIAMDSDDLIELKESIIRAEKKEKTIKKTLGKTVSIINLK